MMLSKNLRLGYTELEAAELLGISVERLRDLVCRHIVKEGLETSSLEYTSFQQSDLLLLKFLAGQRLDTSVSVAGL